jgi:hypothetical protein
MNCIKIKVFQLGLSAILLSGLLFSCNSNSTENKVSAPEEIEKKDTLHGNRKGGSSPSNYPDLQAKLARYMSDSNNNFLLTQFKDSAGNVKTTKLQGFVFTAKQLKQLIGHKYGNVDVTQVVFYFGLDTTSFTSNGKSFGRIRVSAVGMDTSGNLVFIPGGTQPSAAPNETVLDQADPCPPNGPFDPPATAFTIPTIKSKPKN